MRSEKDEAKLQRRLAKIRETRQVTAQDLIDALDIGERLQRVLANAVANGDRVHVPDVNSRDGAMIEKRGGGWRGTLDFALTLCACHLQDVASEPPPNVSKPITTRSRLWPEWTYFRAARHGEVDADIVKRHYGETAIGFVPASWPSTDEMRSELDDIAQTIDAIEADSSRHAVQRWLDSNETRYDLAIGYMKTRTELMETARALLTETEVIGMLRTRQQGGIGE